MVGQVRVAPTARTLMLKLLLKLSSGENKHASIIGDC